MVLSSNVGHLVHLQVTLIFAGDRDEKKEQFAAFKYPDKLSDELPLSKQF